MNSSNNSPTARSMIEQIMARRSYRRRFSDHRITREDLELITACGLAAPSSKNAQPWRFHVVTNRHLLTEIAGAVRSSTDAPNYHPVSHKTNTDRWESTVVESANILENAPAAIFIENLSYFAGGRNTSTKLRSNDLRNWVIAYGFEMIGLGAAIENMWLAAESLGMSTVFLGDIGVEERFICERLSFSGDLVGAQVLGHAMDSVESRSDPPDVTLRVVWHQT